MHPRFLPLVGYYTLKGAFIRNFLEIKSKNYQTIIC